MNFDSLVRTVATYCSRIGQCFSTSVDAVGIDVSEGASWETSEDVCTDDGKCFSDGVGRISQELASVVSEYEMNFLFEQVVIYNFHDDDCDSDDNIRIIKNHHMVMVVVVVMMMTMTMTMTTMTIKILLLITYNFTKTFWNTLTLTCPSGFHETWMGVRSICHSSQICRLQRCSHPRSHAPWKNRNFPRKHAKV